MYQLTSFSSFFLEASFFSRLALASTASLAFLSAMNSDGELGEALVDVNLKKKYKLKGEQFQL